jgi:phosphoadenosine phosphosulfate reductase
MQTELTKNHLEELNLSLEGEHPREILRFALQTFGDELLFTSAFGPDAGVLLHLWSQLAPERPVTFIDTGFLFQETLDYQRQLIELLKLNVVTLRPTIGREAFLAKHGENIYEVNSEFCCAQNRIEPIQRVVRGAKAWVSGLRRDQGGARSQTPILLATEDGPVKVHPLANFNAKLMYKYLQEHNIPEHPLAAQGYTSVGCAPCTRPPIEGEGERSGRWAGTSKTECGLHTFLKPKQ